jgi:HK97 family phage portal protein
MLQRIKQLFASNKTKETVPMPYGEGLWFGFGKQTINYKSMMSNSSKNPFVSACINEITSAFNSVDIGVYKKESDGSLTPAFTHTVNDWLRNPNSELIQSDFQEYFIHYLLIGGGLLLYKTDGLLKKDLHIYSPEAFSVLRNDGEIGIGGIKIGDLIVKDEGLENYKIVRSVNIADKLAGYTKVFRPLADGAGIAIDLSNNGLAHQSLQLQNQGRRSGIISYKKGLRPTEKAEAQNAIKSVGVGEMLMLNGDDFSFTPVDSTPTELDWLDSMKASREYIAGVFGVPVQLISNEGSTYANLKEAKKKLYLDTIKPLVIKYTEVLTAFLNEELGDDFVVSYSMSNIGALSEDVSTQIKTLREALDGIASVEEIRTILSDNFGLNLPNEEGGVDISES